MKIRIIENSRLPHLLGANGVTIYPFVFIDCSVKNAVVSRLIQHEWIHVGQIRKLGICRFYFTYFWQFMVKFLKYGDRDKAYRSISYEIEAYGMQSAIPTPDWMRKGEVKEP